MNALHEAAQQALDDVPESRYGCGMNFADFVELLKKQALYETIYKDTEGREILVIRTLDLFEFVRSALAQPEPPAEPVAWVEAPYGEIRVNPLYRLQFPQSLALSIPLYAAPPQRKPLTDEELDELAVGDDGLPNSHLEFARAIERAHGITTNERKEND